MSASASMTVVWREGLPWGGVRCLPGATSPSSYPVWWRVSLIESCYGWRARAFNVLYRKWPKRVWRRPSSCPINVVALRQGLPSVHFVDQDAAKVWRNIMIVRRYMTERNLSENASSSAGLENDRNDALAARGCRPLTRASTDRDVRVRYCAL